ncbi:MAG: amidohydrolase [Bacteroidales bacterium]|nr:amidohydrolase [Bacteroidales bacterium]
MPDSDIIRLRHDLHSEPEVSNREKKTAERIREFIGKMKPAAITGVGSTGVAFTFNGKSEGPVVMFRSELDALPVTETTDLPYSSSIKGVAHACGHDGHMAILAALAKRIAAEPPLRGKAVLLYQPAEEVEQGARDVVNDPRFRDIEPDYIFALHNIPGEKSGSVILRNGTFAAASKGMTVKLHGKTSHAGEPENGISPAAAISDIIRELHTLREDKSLFKSLTLLTIIHIRMGEVSFGTSPGYAEIMITLRAYENRDMEMLTSRAEEIVRSAAEREHLGVEIAYDEIFPATVNDPGCVDMVRESAREIPLTVQNNDHPYRWSEDFAYFTEKYSGCLFGLGAGTGQPALHNPEYDFPDTIIDPGTEIFFNIYKKLLR